MPTETEIRTERERLYESPVLREELNDDDATILLEWGEKHVVRLAQEAADGAALEENARFLRQLLKNMNRFVGQRQYDNRDEQLGYLEKVIQWLSKLGFKEHNGPELLDKMPSDTKDMNGTLRALISAIDPHTGSPAAGSPAQKPPQDQLSTLKDALSGQKPDSLDSHHTGSPAAGSPAQKPPQDQLSTLKDALSGQKPDALDSHMPHHAPENDSQAPTYDTMRQSVIDQMKKASYESSVGDLMDKAQSQPKENDALNSLRKTLGLQPSDSSSEERHLTKPSSSEGDSAHGEHSRSDHLIHPTHTREEGKDDGKTTE